MDLFSSPIVIGVIAGVLTYLYLYWEADKAQKENPKNKKKPVKFFTPAVIGVIVWFLAANYLCEQPTQQQGYPGYQDAVQIQNSYKLVGPVGPVRPVRPVGNTASPVGSFGSISYHLVGRNNIKLPPTDVFIDLARIHNGTCFPSCHVRAITFIQNWRACLIVKIMDRINLKIRI